MQTNGYYIYGRIISLLLFFSIYIFPVSLFYFNVISYAARGSILVFLTILMILYAVYKKYTLKDLGLAGKYLKGSLLVNGIFSLVTITGLFTFYKLNMIREPVEPEYDLFFIYYIFVSCTCQEFLYRSLVYKELSRNGIRGNYFIIISAINYSFLHVFYHDWITLVSTLISGLIWGWIYNKYPNFWGVALSHATLGVISMMVGLI
jgi:uncharacterized protein